MTTQEFKNILDSLETLISHSEHEKIDAKYDSGKIRGTNIYHAGSAGDAYLQGRRAALSLFKEYVKQGLEKTKE